MKRASHSQLPALNQPFAGGIFVGLIQSNGQIRAIIASDKRGRLRGQWGEYGQDIIGARSVNDGHANTLAMAEAGSAVAKQALALDIDGLTDWYLPSRDEYELVYRQLKPTTQQNYCSFRDGENPSALPATLAYTPDFPAQTTVIGYRAGEEHALEAGWHWTSTQYSAGTAWVQNFGDGYQYYGTKGNEYAVQAVRSVVIE